MATRPTKTAGNTSYTAEVAAGAKTIKSSEVDADLNELYTNITNANVSGGAAIAYSKLNLAAALQAGDYAPGSVNTAALGALAVTTAKIADGNVTAAKLATGVSTKQLTSSSVVANLNFSTLETTLAQTASLTYGGGTIAVLASIAAHFSFTVAVASAVTLRFYNGPAGTTLLATQEYQVNNNEAGVAVDNWPFAVLFPVLLSGAAGTHIFKVTAQTGSTNLQMNTRNSAGNVGKIYALEFP